MKFIFKIAIDISCTWKHSIVKSMVSCFAVMYQMKSYSWYFCYTLTFLLFVFILFTLVYLYDSISLCISHAAFLPAEIIHISMNLSAPSICFLAIQYNLSIVI